MGWAQVLFLAAGFTASLVKEGVAYYSAKKKEKAYAEQVDRLTVLKDKQRALSKLVAQRKLYRDRRKAQATAANVAASRGLQGRAFFADRFESEEKEKLAQLEKSSSIAGSIDETTAAAQKIAGRAPTPLEAATGITLGAVAGISQVIGTSQTASSKLYEAAGSPLGEEGKLP